MKQFNVPTGYRSSLISAIKQYRKDADKLKKDFTPTLLKIGDLDIYLARHFGFCYGVENAIEIAFRTIDENPGKRIFLLSEMIHNPQVNEDLLARGVRFLQDTHGKFLIPLETLTKEDIVIIPAFGTTLDMEATLAAKGIVTEKYNTTCPFVETPSSIGTILKLPPSIFTKTKGLFCHFTQPVKARSVFYGQVSSADVASHHRSFIQL
jgi:4-hydroxy-3-methylbut-2-enyl diphosphate reductase